MAVSAEKAASGGSSKAFLTSLVANVGLLSIEVGAFVILKARISRIYSPRTFLPPPEVCARTRGVLVSNPCNSLRNDPRHFP